MAILSPGLAPRAIRPRARLLVALVASPQVMTRSPWMKAGASAGTAGEMASRMSPKFQPTRCFPKCSLSVIGLQALRAISPPSTGIVTPVM